MTLMMIWTNKPSDPTAVSMASDSRLSVGKTTWDYARKIHPLHPSRAFMAYCGGSIAALSAVTSGNGLLMASDNLSKVGTDDAPTLEARVAALYLNLKDTLAVIPCSWGRAATLVYCDWDHRKERYSAWKIEITMSNVEEPVELDLVSQRVFFFGSGAKQAESLLKNQIESGELSTKSVIGALVEVIDGAHSGVGGAPQMVMLNRNKSRPVGFWWDPKRGKGVARRFLFGTPVEFSSPMKTVLWKTEKFENRAHSVFRRR